MSDPLVIPVRARSASMLYALVMDEVQRGYSLSQTMFLGNDGMICQWVELGNDHLEYQLVEGLTIVELDFKVRQWMQEGYYMLFNTLPFSHGYLQWVARSKDNISLSSISENTTLSMVAGVQPVMRIVPVLSFASSFAGVPSILDVKA
jgi:hypothetical protein